MAQERHKGNLERELSSARILMISRFKDGSIGGIPSTVQSLNYIWKNHVRNITILQPDNQSRTNLMDDWDLVIFHHPSMFGVMKFLELPNELKSKSSIIWYQAVDKETLNNFRRLGVGTHNLVPSIISVNTEIITRRILTNYPGVLNYAISENVRDSLTKARITSKEKISLIQIPPTLLPDMGISKDFEMRGNGEFVILVVSRISPEKGIERVLEIYEQIFKFSETFSESSLKPVKFVVVGEAANKPYGDSITERVRELPTNSRCNIELIGKQTGKDLAQSYQDSHIFLMPSVVDSWGLVTIEAMHYGLPIVSFDAPGTREIFSVSKDEIGKIVNNIRASSELITQIMKDKTLWSRFSRGALNESRKYLPEEVSLNLLKKLWSDRYNTK